MNRRVLPLMVVSYDLNTTLQGGLWPLRSGGLWSGVPPCRLPDLGKTSNHSLQTRRASGFSLGSRQGTQHSRQHLQGASFLLRTAEGKTTGKGGFSAVLGFLGLLIQFIPSWLQLQKQPSFSLKLVGCCQLHVLLKFQSSAGSIDHSDFPPEVAGPGNIMCTSAESTRWRLFSVSTTPAQ